MLKKHWDKIVFALGILVLVYAYGIATVAFDLFPYQSIHAAKRAAMDWKRHWGTYLNVEPSRFIYPSAYEGDGVVKHIPEKSQSGVTFMTGLRNQDVSIWLVNERGKLLHEWPIRTLELWPDTSHLKGYDTPTSNWEAQVHGAVLLPEGEVIFNIEFIGLLKLNKCGDVMWRLPYMTHHSVYLSEDNTLWVSGRKFHDKTNSKFTGMNPNFWEPTAIQVSLDGKIMQEISLLDILFDNEMQALIYSSNPKGDWAHLNDVEVFEKSVAQVSNKFEEGDILVSLRNLHLLFIFSPSTKKIKWYRTGPWLNQHDPDILPDATISVFDNRRLRRRGFGETLGGKSELFSGSRIIVVNPEENHFKTIYEGNQDNSFYTNVMGKHQYLANGNILLSQTEGGRVLEITDAGEIVWEYINRYDENRVAVIQQADRYPSEYANFIEGACK